MINFIRAVNSFWMVLFSHQFILLIHEPEGENEVLSLLCSNPDHQKELIKAVADQVKNLTIVVEKIRRES